MARAEAPRVSNPEQDFATLRERIAAFEAGSLDADSFKRCRLQMGVYGIRGEQATHMVRIKVPGGRVTAGQLVALAAAAETYATGHGHLTTRQDVQLYFVPRAKVPDLLQYLEAAGLTTREACGNSVRNVTGCPYAGLCPDERFDVTPYVELITQHYLRHPRTQALPRKFKMSLSGCGHDRAMAAIHDVGICAVNDGGRLGFRIYVGGGLGSTPRTADLFEPFTPAAQLLPTLDAILEVFDRHGDRTNRSRARMKFLLMKIGFDAFKRLVEEARAAADARGSYPRAPEPAAPVPTAWPAVRPAAPDAAAGRWLLTNAEPQRQPGRWIVTVRLPLGDLTSAQMRALAGCAQRHGQGLAVIAQWQDLAIPGVLTEQLLPLYGELSAIGLAQADAQQIQDVTACPGAETCQIGITASRGLARAVTEVLEGERYRAPQVADLRIKMSGCPNSCGQHQVADIGFYGAAKSVNGHLVPHYQVLLGGMTAEGLAQFGLPILRLPARRVPEAVEALLAFVQARRAPHEPFRAFVERVGVEPIRALLAPFAELADARAAACDWGATTPFSLSGVGTGECAG